jgi:hypothetical protein
MDYEVGETLRYWIVASTILLIIVSLIFAITYYNLMENPYNKCQDFCQTIRDNTQLRADCYARCTYALKDTLDRALSIANETLQKINWSNQNVP